MNTAYSIYTNFNHSLQLLIIECEILGEKTYNQELRTTEYLFKDGSYILISAGHVSHYASK
jgi:hypothetical protein